jgi:glycosyltransferase involved in cell wall biosynthesis
VKILTVVHQFFPRHFAGTEQLTHLVAGGLRRRGHEVRLLCAERDTGRPAYSVRDEEFEGLPLWEVAYDHRFEDYADMYADASMTRVFARCLDAWRPDLVHLQHTAFFGFEIIAEATRRGIPVVATLNDYYWICPRSTFLLEDLSICAGPSHAGCGRCMRAFPLRPERYGCAPEDRAGALPRALERRAAFLAARAGEVRCFVAPSRFLLDVFEAHGEPFRGKLLRIEQGLPERARRSEPRPAPAPRAGRIVFGYAGTLADFKGVAVLVEAFAGLRGEDLVLEIHGEPSWFVDYVARLRELAQGDPRIRFLGSFDPRRAHETHARFDALVVPSLWYENAPVTILEARREGLPVIATDLGGMREAVQDGVDGLLFPRGDALALRGCLARFAEDGDLRLRLREGVRAPRPAEAMIADYEALFERTIAGAAAS